MAQTSVSYLHMPLTSRIDRVAARQTHRKSHLWVKWLILALIVAGVGFGLWKGSVFLLGKTFMAVQSVEVNGLNYLSRAEVDEVLAGFKLENTLEVDTTALECQLALLDYVAVVGVEKAYPNKIVINIKERLPVAFSMQAGNLVALSSDGYLLPVDSRLGAPTMPLFYGEIASEDGSSDQVELSRNMLAMLGIIKVELPQLYTQIESVKSSAQVLRLTDGSVVICGWQNTREDLARLSAVRSLLLSQNEKASIFDLRYKNQVIVKGLIGGLDVGNTPVIAVNLMPPALPVNQRMVDKKDVAIKKPAAISNQPLKTKTSVKTETKKANSSLTAGPKSRVKSGKPAAQNSGKKVGR